MKHIGWVIVAALALLTGVLYATAKAEYAPIVQPRIMSGLFCNTQEAVTTVVENGRESQAAFTAAMAGINAQKQVCILHTASRVMVESMTFVQSDTYDGEKLYLYRASIVGFVFGNIPVRIEPKVEQFVYMVEALSPTHVDYSL